LAKAKISICCCITTHPIDQLNVHLRLKSKLSLSKVLS